MHNYSTHVIVSQVTRFRHIKSLSMLSLTMHFSNLTHHLLQIPKKFLIVLVLNKSLLAFKIYSTFIPEHRLRLQDLVISKTTNQKQLEHEMNTC